VVHFQPWGGGAQLEGLQMKGGSLVVYTLRDGSVWRAVYGPGAHPLVSQEALGAEIAYFHLVPLQQGIHVALELSHTTPSGAGYGSGSPETKRFELSTVVVARGW